MPVIVRNVPSGHDWSWHSREDQRMHLQSVDEQHDYKVWLEEKGERTFESVGKIPSKVVKALREYVAEHRIHIEDRWVRLMLDKHWLHLYIALPKLTLVAYPNMPLSANTQYTASIMGSVNGVAFSRSFSFTTFPVPV